MTTTYPPGLIDFRIDHLLADLDWIASGTACMEEITGKRWGPVAAHISGQFGHIAAIAGNIDDPRFVALSGLFEQTRYLGDDEYAPRLAADLAAKVRTTRDMAEEAKPEEKEVKI